MSSSQISDIWVLLLITHNIILQWVVPKKIHTPPTEEISHLGRGGGELSKECFEFLQAVRRGAEGYC